MLPLAALCCHLILSELSLRRSAFEAAAALCDAMHDQVDSNSAGEKRSLSEFSHPVKNTDGEESFSLCE